MFEIITKNLNEDVTSDLPVALEQLDKYITFYAYCVKNKISINDLEKLSDDYVAVSKEEYEYIETALKEYEGAKNHIEALNKERVENSIKLKALEIIKEKRVEVMWLINRPLEDYNKNHFFELTKEEFDLLKEVLA